MAKKKEVDPATTTAIVVRAASAMTAAVEFSAVVEKIMESGGECDDETLAALKGWEGQLEYKAENIGLVKLGIETRNVHFKAIEDAASARRTAGEKTIERLKKYAMECMKAAGKDTIKKEDGLFSFSISEGRTRLVVDNPDLLPEEYADIVLVVRPKSDLIKKALETGEIIPGAHLERSADFLTIRGGKLSLE